jgi:hypothetical protein
MFAMIIALQQDSAADLNFVREMRHGLNEAIYGMENVCHRRGDSLHELEEEMQDNGHLLRSDLVNEVEALKREKRALTEELQIVRAYSETMRSVDPTTQQNVWHLSKASIYYIDIYPQVTQAGLSTRRKPLYQIPISRTITSNQGAVR